MNKNQFEDEPAFGFGSFDEASFYRTSMDSPRSIERDEDVKPTPGKINNHPTRGDGRCSCCGRHWRQLKPFGKAGDPLRGDFEGAWLVQRYRAFAALDKEIEKILKEFFGAYEDYEKVIEKLSEEYGPEEAREMLNYAEATGATFKSWECRDCACLSTKRYHIMDRSIYWGEP
jgi:hypothetical protein